MSKHTAPIMRHLARPRQVGIEGLNEFSIQKTFVVGRDRKQPARMRYGWNVLYMGQHVTTFITKKEAYEFIKEKLST